MFKNAVARLREGRARMRKNNDRYGMPPIESARQLALDALLFLLGDSLRITKFLNVTGMEAAELRAHAREDATLVAVLEYLLADETQLLVFAANGGHDPTDIAPALERLQRDGDM
jgi:hypothetical protein